MQALGSIEVVGFVAGAEAADVARKTADINLIGYEPTKGGGYIIVEVEGQVTVVQATMAAAEVAAPRLARVVNRVAIPRLHQELESIAFSATTVDPTKSVSDAEVAKPATKAKTPERTKSALRAEIKTQEKPEPESEAGTTNEPGPEPRAITKPEPKPQFEQAQPEPGPDRKSNATLKNPAETTRAPRASTTRRKQS